MAEGSGLRHRLRRPRGEFALASALIKARGDADMTQEQVAAAMGTTQAFVARLDSGRAMPSTRTLEKFAKATHTKLRISFEPASPLGVPRRRKRDTAERDRRVNPSLHILFLYCNQFSRSRDFRP
jgi:transcriptional regulator with XRE-family HTH domain